MQTLITTQLKVLLWIQLLQTSQNKYLDGIGEIKIQRGSHVKAGNTDGREYLTLPFSVPLGGGEEFKKQPNNIHLISEIISQMILPI